MRSCTGLGDRPFLNLSLPSLLLLAKAPETNGHHYSSGPKTEGLR
jgi:hypothetical protein